MTTQRPGESRVLVEAREFRAAILARDRAMLRELTAQYRPIIATARARLADVAALIARRARAGVPQTPGSVVRLGEYQALIAELEALLHGYAGRTAALITAEQRRRIDAAVGHARALVEAQLPGQVASLAALGVSWATVNPEALEVMVGSMRDGTTLRSYLERQIVRGTVERLTSTLASGIGDNPRVTARAIRGQLAGGAVQAQRIARTETLRAYREATRAQYEANSAMVKGYRRVEALDSRTCAACWIMDGTLYASESEMDEHVSGRGFTVPEMVSPRELGIPMDAPPLYEYEDTGRARFLRMGEDQQRRIVGNDRLYDAYRSGRIGLNGLVRVDRDPIWGTTITTNSAVRALAGDHAPRLPSFDTEWDSSRR